ncbi:hypothetical protein RJ639_044525 [Escallonia herrerae]|uniref:Cytochrome b-c1 complex subunit 7 n=1 Tax=Escallonia herrerae TaxID=1293975 RepID=A0AA88WDV8_9ASTE|nr:hypothetical protein RJ639_044525 [Escallonia herrerae]
MDGRPKEELASRPPQASHLQPPPQIRYSSENTITYISFLHTLPPRNLVMPTRIGVRTGLRYDDLYDPMYDLDIKEALNRLPREVVDARNQRLKRAMDLSMKHEYLPDDLQVKREREEREALGALPLYQRTIP